MKYGVLFLVIATACAGCTSDSLESPVVNREPIINGDPDDEHDGVVQILSMAMCSGTYIAPSLVLTAEHCLEGTRGSSWTVEQGSRPPLVTIDRGRNAVIPRDVSDDPAEDLALLTTAGRIGFAPYFSAVDLGDMVVGSRVTVVGYGQDEEGRSGYRQHTEMTVAEIYPLSLTLVGDSYPYSGDSGGPVFDERGHVVGVISRGWDGGVVVARVDTHRWFLDPFIRSEGGCVVGDPELCDGRDNDCDGVIDPDCSQLGETCSSTEDCVEGECLDVAGENVCTILCSPGSIDDCFDGGYCFETSCGEGLCRSGVAGDAALGETCSDDRDCESLTCRDFAGRGSLCTNRCRVDEMECADDEACIPLDGECGGCLSLELAEGERGVGEGCEDDDDCRDELECIDDHPHSYCSRPCEDNGDCPAGTHCRPSLGACVRGDLGDYGAPCLEDGDCVSGLCQATDDGSSFCSDDCERGIECPRRSSCETGEGYCDPWDFPLGARCDGDEEGECLEGECVELDGEARCVASCGRYCASGFECRSIDGEDYCWPVDPPKDDGCSCSAAGQRSSSSLHRLLDIVFTFFLSR